MFNTLSDALAMHPPFVNISVRIPVTSQEGNHMVAFKLCLEAISAINQNYRASHVWIDGALGLSNISGRS
jgi:hypothetical protein